MDVQQLMSAQLNSEKVGSHTTTCTAGEKGCTAFIFRKENLVSFFDENQGVLLSFLGLKVVV